jgi:hypothetical protein
MGSTGSVHKIFAYFRFNQREYSQFRNSLVASYLSYCEYYRYIFSSTCGFDRNGRPASSVVDLDPGAKKLTKINVKSDFQL